MILSQNFFQEMSVTTLNSMMRFITSFENQQKSNECFLQTCQGKAISSHSISQSIVLKRLCGRTESGIGLYHLDDYPEPDKLKKVLSTYKKSRRSLKPFGASKSSTFYGYCNPHDTKLFELLDKNCFNDTPRIRFLHSLRAYSHYIVKWGGVDDLLKTQCSFNLRGLSKEWENLSKLVTAHLGVLSEQLHDEDCILYSDVEKHINNANNVHATSFYRHPVEQVRKIAGLLKAERLFLPESYPIKGRELKEKIAETRSIIDFCIETSVAETGVLSHVLTEVRATHRDWSNKLNSIAVGKKYQEFSSATIMLNVECKFAGSFLVRIDDQVLSLTVLPDTGRTCLIFGSFNESGRFDMIIGKLKIKEINELEQFVSNLIVNQGYNVYFSPEYWNALTSIEKESIVKGEITASNDGFNLFKREG